MGQPTLSIVIPTLGRASLEDTLDSVIGQLDYGDQIIVVRDSHGDPTDRNNVCARVAKYAPVMVYAEYDAGCHYYGGTAQSNYGFSLATGDFILSIGDDDAYIAGAIAKVRDALVPEKALIARVFISGNGMILPTEHVMERHHINGSGFAAPRQAIVDFPLSGEPSADFDWMTAIIAATDREPVWLDACIVINGASRRNGRIANAGPVRCQDCRRMLLAEDAEGGRCIVCRTPLAEVPPQPQAIRPRKIAFVWPAAEMSVSDVARGYRHALARAGHAVVDFKLHNHFKYHAAALERSPGGDRSGDMGILSKQATEGIAAFVLRHEPDLVVIVSGMSFHPDGLVYLRKLGVPTVTIFTESPYDDPQQKAYAEVYPEMVCATQDIASARANCWVYLPPAFDAALHRRVPPTEEFTCDVFMVATGWAERQALLEGVDWTGIDCRLYGHWLGVKPGDRLFQLVRFTPTGSVLLSNSVVAHAYASAAISLNIHRDWVRGGDEAASVNPRVMEIAACGGFLLTDHRPELERLFGDVPMFDPRTPGDLERQIRWWLAHPAERAAIAARMHTTAIEAIKSETFDARVRTLFEALDRQRAATAVA